MAVASSPAGGSRRWAVAAAAYDSGVSSETFDHSISEARSRTAGAVEPQPQPAAGLGDGARLVRHHLGGGAADGLRPEVVQLAQRGGVEGAGLHAADAEVAQPGAHLAGRAGGEGDRQHPLRLVDARAARRRRCGG